MRNHAMILYFLPSKQQHSLPQCMNWYNTLCLDQAITFLQNVWHSEHQTEAFLVLFLQFQMLKHYVIKKTASHLYNKGNSCMANSVKPCDFIFKSYLIKHYLIAAIKMQILPLCTLLLILASFKQQPFLTFRPKSEKIIHCQGKKKMQSTCTKCVRVHRHVDYIIYH